MTDIVERLRDWENVYDEDAEIGDLEKASADEIEDLRAEVRRLQVSRKVLQKDNKKLRKRVTELADMVERAFRDGYDSYQTPACAYNTQDEAWEESGYRAALASNEDNQ